MAIINAEQRATILRAQLANILKKQALGKILSPREQLVIDEAAGHIADSDAGNFAANWEDLATRLGITRRGLQKIRVRFTGQTPTPKADNRHNIAAWSSFFVAHNINARAIDAEPPGPEDELATTSEAEWRKRELREKVARLQLANALTRRELVPLSEVQETLPQFLSAIRGDLNQLVTDLATDLEGIDDFYERETIIQTRVDQLLNLLSTCTWLDAQPVADETKADIRETKTDKKATKGDKNATPNQTPSTSHQGVEEKFSNSRIQEKPKPKPVRSSKKPKLSTSGKTIIRPPTKKRRALKKV